MASGSKYKRLWLAWGVLSVMALGYFAAGMWYDGAKTSPLLVPAREALLPGHTSHGHYQVELACEACHTDPFGGRDALQQACIGCHGAELEEADDSHPASKFNDPRNVERLEKLDAQQCVTCHVEHRPDMAREMSVTLPRDVCFHCHSGPEEMPPDHEGMAFDTCTNSGCHNFHDNRALYEDFLLRHAGDPALKEIRQLAMRDFHATKFEMMAYPQDRYPLRALAANEADAPAAKQQGEAMAHWLASTHAANGVNCSACHGAASDAANTWNAKPDHNTCKTCHGPEVTGFLSGKHGMRLAQGLSAMRPEWARAAMNDDAHGRELSCSSCHDAHGVDTRRAAVDACEGCHADEHTRAYRQSKHFELWQQELAGKLPPGSGVSCASCHMPRLRMPTDDGSRMVVQHNQNDTLRPNSKMLRPVCQSCHGLGFSIDAMADRALINRNFTGQPARHVESIDMAVKKDAETHVRRANGSGE